MIDLFPITIDGETRQVREGTTVAAAVLQSHGFSRRSVSGGTRQPLCGMGICYECRVEIDGRLHQRSCQILCQSGMKVVTA
jgi:predicted molibdopterin-dependent oxidoreductase YjgC